MTFANTWLNNDGLKVPFGTSDGIQKEGASIHTKGMDKELRLDLDHSNLPVIGSAIQGDNIGIPTGAVILEAGLECTETFSGAITIGTMDSAGADIDADGLLTTGTPTAGSYTVGSGALIGTVTTEANYVSVAGSVTTGAGTLVVKYRI